MRLPDFIICGAMKAGTTAVAGMLRSRDDVFMPGGETHFFDKHAARHSVQSYKKKFRDESGVVLWGEKTPRYMAVPNAMVHLSRVAPDVKLIVLLRDPVRRYLSHFAHWNRLLRTGKKKRRQLTFKQFAESRAGIDAIWRGLYASQLELIYGLFPSENVWVVFSEVLRRDTQRTMMQIQGFLGLSPQLLVNTPGPERPVVPTDERHQQLGEYYRPHNERLAGLLDSRGWDSSQIKHWAGVEA